MAPLAAEICSALGAPASYLRLVKGQWLLACSGAWLGDLVRDGRVPHTFPRHPNLKDAEVQAYLADTNLPHSQWTILTLEAFSLKEELLCSQSQNHPTPKSSPCKTFPELIHQINDNIFKTEWRKTHEQFSCPWSDDKAETPSLRGIPWTGQLLRLCRRLYDVPVVVNENVANKEALVCDDDTPKYDEYVSNLVNLNCVVVAPSVVLLLYNHQKYSVHNLLSYSSSLLAEGHIKQLFILFQIIHIFKVFQDHGMEVGDVTLHDFFITKNLHIRAYPKLAVNLSSIPEDTYSSTVMYREKFQDKESEALMNYVETVLENQPVLTPRDNESILAQAVDLWISGRISNLDYLLFLNYLSGRRFGHPNHHPVVPWVTDFSDKHRGWRDLTRSKFRLNKGDQQLDLTYESGKVDNSQHHVSDVLSEITYYTYKSRRTDRAVLCRTVRPNWVPGQYPSSIQRMFEWSPDEAIPEFYMDPAIFSSIHDDLPDLELPPWTSTNEEFVDWHLAKMESDEVSASLNTWIDLTFGYKLSGSAAVRAKNVCLDLVDNHKDLRISGVVQLFTQPHPTRRSRQICCVPPSTEVVEQVKEDALSSDSEEEEQSNELAKFLSKSRTSLSSLQDDSSKKSVDQEELVLNCPADYNPIASLLELESVHNFNAKAMSSVDYPLKSSSKEDANLLSREEERQIRNLKILGCLIMELFLPKKFSCLGQFSGLPARYEIANQILRYEIKLVPHCIRETVLSLLLPNMTSINLSSEDSVEHSLVSSCGLPLPSAEQLLTPLMSSLPFPPWFTTLHHTLAGLESTNDDLNNVKLFNVGDVSKAEEKGSEFQVKLVARRLVPLMAEMSMEEFELILPLVKSVMSTPRTAVMASWLLLDPASCVLGPARAGEHFLQPLLALYHNSSPTSKHLKLYHRSFLVTIIVRLKLHTFLKHFTNLLIEAVGGYKDVEFSGSREGLEQSWKDPANSVSDVEQPSNSPDQPKSLSPSPTNEPSEFEEGEVFKFDSIDDVPLTKHNSDIPDDLMESLDQSFRNTVISPNGGKTSDPLFYVPSNLDHPLVPVAEVHPQPDPCLRRNTGNVSAVAGESVMWLAHRLGPVLSSRYLAKNLLRMLNLCYQGPEGCRPTGEPFPNQRIRLSPSSVSGDIAAGPVLDCLAHVAGLYGDQVILVQYLPYSWDLISLCRKRVNSNLEGGLLGCLAMVHTIIPLLTDSILMNELEDHFLGQIVLPCLQIVTTRRLVFTGGSRPRLVLLYKLMDIIYLMGLRIGEEMARKSITVVVVALFSSFDKIYSGVLVPSTPEIPPGDTDESVDHNDAVLGELKGVLTPEVAYTAYVAFYHLLGGGHLDASLTNLELIKTLCCQHQAKLTNTPHRPLAFSELQAGNAEKTNSSSFGGTSGGNKIVVSSDDGLDGSPSDEVALISRPCHDSGRHLRGNWLAYWEHEIGRPADTSLNFKQIRLQTWAGHVGSVRSLSVLNGENSFLSGGKDKTVRLWSLRNCGDGSSVCAPQSVYTNHKKPVFSVTYLERGGLAASCDGVIQLWDPFVGSLVHEVEAGKGGAFCVMRGLEAPTPAIAAATTDALVRIIDTRSGNKATHLKVSHGSSGIIRSMAVSRDGNLLAVGHSSGFISLMDLRGGRLRNGFKAHDGEVITLTNIDNKHFVSTSLDQTASGWRWEDGRHSTPLRAPPEPLHCVCAHDGEVITGSTANRVTVHSKVATDAVVNVNKLRSDILKGNLMQLAVLPLNRMLLLATDTGHVHLVC